MHGADEGGVRVCGGVTMKRRLWWLVFLAGCVGGEPVAPGWCAAADTVRWAEEWVVEARLECPSIKTKEVR